MRGETALISPDSLASTIAKKRKSIYLLYLLR